MLCYTVMTALIRLLCHLFGRYWFRVTLQKVCFCRRTTARFVAFALRSNLMITVFSMHDALKGLHLSAHKAKRVRDEGVVNTLSPFFSFILLSFNTPL
jgi:hypothetical protein